MRLCWPGRTEKCLFPLKICEKHGLFFFFSLCHIIHLVECVYILSYFLSRHILAHLCCQVAWNRPESFAIANQRPAGWSHFFCWTKQLDLTNLEACWRQEEKVYFRILSKLICKRWSTLLFKYISVTFSPEKNVSNVDSVNSTMRLLRAVVSGLFFFFF